MLETCCGSAGTVFLTHVAIDSSEIAPRVVSDATVPPPSLPPVVSVTGTGPNRGDSMSGLRKIAGIAAACVSLAVLAPNSSRAQQVNAPTGAPATIRLDVVVAHKNGPPVGGLDQKDFTIIDNKHTQPITSFRAVSGRDSSAHVIIVLDAVNIDFERVAFAREEIEKYLRAEGGQLTHPTSFAILTDDGMKLQQQYSTDGNSISAAV